MAPTAPASSPWTSGPTQVATSTTRLLAELVDSNPDAMVVVDELGLIVLANKRVEALFGHAPDDLLGQPVELLIPERQRPAHRSARAGYAKAPTQRPMGAGAELRARRRDGSEFPVEVSLAPLHVNDRTAIAAVIRDVSERHAAQANLEWLALHDGMTGLANRPLLLDRLKTTIARGVRAARPAAVFFLDIDRLKWVNDSLGHDAGDALLLAVAQRLSRTVRPHDTVGRVGGDEFVAVVEDVEDARALAERMLAAIGEPLTLLGREIRPQVSLGIVILDRVGAEPAAVLRDADTAMYRAKRRGRGRYELFQDHWRDEDIADFDLLIALEKAVVDEDVDVHYQPVLHAVTGHVWGVEALVRWTGPNGPMSAQRVVGLAEQSKLILELDELVMMRACRQIAEIRPDGPLRVGVNVSARHLSTGDLPGLVKRSLALSGLAPDRLWLELTESERLTEGDGLAILREIAATGVVIAIDDFGTGFSSLSRLRDLPVSLLKIDKSFVAHTGDDDRGPALLAAMVGVGHALGLTVLAEGIETPEQATTLQLLGSELGQGFHWSAALSIADLDTWLAGPLREGQL